MSDAPKVGKFLGFDFLWWYLWRPAKWSFGSQWLTDDEKASGKWLFAHNLIWLKFGFFDLNFERIDP